MPHLTGLSGNEIYCLALKNYLPGNLVIGNSVRSLGLRGTIGSETKGMLGLEIKDITQMIREGRQLAYQRMLETSTSNVGTIAVTNKLILHPTSVEFLASGSQILPQHATSEKLSFSAHANGQELYALQDAGYQPCAFVFGNVAYSTAMTGGVVGRLKAFNRGEIQKFSESFHRTRLLPLERLMEQAKENKANAVLGINAITTPFTGVNEMLMQGTAAFHPLLSATDEIATSNLTLQEMWSLAKLGYAPIRILLSSSIYSLGFVNGMTAIFKSLLGENTELTQLIHEARKNALTNLEKEAALVNAETVVGIRTYVYHLGNGLIEFFAIGTAIKKMTGITTLSDQLPLQSI